MKAVQVASKLVIIAVSLTASATAQAALWEDATMVTIGVTDTWSSKVELADINGDGRVDILFANGRGYSGDQGPEINSAFLNQGPGKPFVEVGAELFGAADATRVIKARDVDGDGDLDIFVGNTWGTQSRLFLGEGEGAFEEVTASNLPQIEANIGDAEFGDVDGDGDLDLVLAEWGPGNPSENEGGIPRLWLNDGEGMFSEAPAGQVPEVLVRWSWELDVADVDNDYDLDLAISCKSCSGSFLLINDGAGHFVDGSDGLPQFANNYEFELLDVNADGNLDMVTINDRSPGNREHLLIGDGDGGFVDETELRWPDSENPAGDDNMVCFLDVESDGDPDFLIAGLFGQPDRLILNDGTGNLTLDPEALTGVDTPGTLGIAVADLNGDNKLDVVLAEGEAADPDFVLLGVDIAPDTAPPVIDRIEEVDGEAGEALTIRARVHDNKTPLADHDFASVLLRYTLDGATEEVAMHSYGGLLWRANLPALAAGTLLYRVCAIDAAGNEACSEEIQGMVGPGVETGGDDSGDDGTGTGDTSGDTTGGTTGAESNGTGDSASGASGTENGTGTETAADTSGDGSSAGCGCVTQSGSPRGGAWLILLGLLGLGRRRPRNS